MKIELDALISNNTWNLFPWPINIKVISSKQVYRVKKLVTNITEKFKSRVIDTGYDQNPRFDLIRTYNSIIKFVTIRDIFTLTQFSLGFYVDIDNAFLNGIFEEYAYMKQPHGFKDPIFLSMFAS